MGAQFGKFTANKRFFDLSTFPKRKLNFILDSKNASRSCFLVSSETKTRSTLEVSMAMLTAAGYKVDLVTGGRAVLNSEPRGEAIFARAGKLIIGIFPDSPQKGDALSMLSWWTPRHDGTYSFKEYQLAHPQGLTGVYFTHRGVTR